MSEINEIEQQEKYPFAVVIIIYGLFGGFVGCVIVALYFVANAVFEGSFSSFGETLILIPFIIVTGAGLGFIPSIFAGIWLALIKFTVTKKIDYFKVAVIGYFSTVFCLGIYNDFNLDSSTSYIGVVGSLSAMILGLALPKRLNSIKNNPIPTRFSRNYNTEEVAELVAKFQATLNAHL